MAVAASSGPQPSVDALDIGLAATTCMGGKFTLLPAVRHLSPGPLI